MVVGPKGARNGAGERGPRDAQVHAVPREEDARLPGAPAPAVGRAPVAYPAADLRAFHINDTTLRTTSKILMYPEKYLKRPKAPTDLPQ